MLKSFQKTIQASSDAVQIKVVQSGEEAALKLFSGRPSRCEKNPEKCTILAMNLHFGGGLSNALGKTVFFFFFNMLSC